MKITSASSSSSASNIINNLVNKIYNLLFGYLDSLFDDDNYEKKEEKIPKSQVKKPENMVDVEGHEIDPEDVEVTGDATVVTFNPKSKMLEAEYTDISEEDIDQNDDEAQSEPKEAPDNPDLDGFSVEMTPCTVKGDNCLLIMVKNNKTGNYSSGKIVPARDNKALKEALDNAKKEVSSTIKVSLTKVTGSSGCSVKLKNIYSTYDVPMTCSDISCILDDTSFIESLPEGDSTYRIDSYDDGYDINELENYEFSNSVYSDTLDCCIKTMSRIYELSWFAKGVDYNNFKNICETLSYNIQYNVTELAKLCIIHGVDPTFEAKSSDASNVIDRWQSLKDCVEGYVASLRLLSLSCTDDEHNMIEGWIRQLNDIILYQWACLHPDKI